MMHVIINFLTIGGIMDISLIGANIVVTAKNHNPSIISKDWLSQKGIIEDKIVSFTHTPAFSVVETENLSFFVDPDRFQLSLKREFVNRVNSLPEKISFYISALPETPYTAIGFNFVYLVKTNGTSLNKIYCYNNEKLKSLFSEDYQLGSLIKYKFGKFAVKLIISPNSDNETVADFNFHCQLENSVKITECIEKYNIIKESSKAALEGLFSE